jgi:hypothetical protein
MRRLVAFAGHAPALWLLYREPLPRALWVPNVLALTLTVAAMLGVGVVACRDRPLWPVVAAWLAGHVIWGAYLAYRLPAAAADPAPRRDP